MKIKNKKRKTIFFNELLTKEIVNELEINIKESENIERWITSQTKKLEEKRILGIIWQLLMLKLYIYIERERLRQDYACCPKL